MTFGPQTALIVVDMQNDFVEEAGSLTVPGANEIIPFVNQTISAAAKAGALVVYTQDWHPFSTPHFEKDGGIWPIHCIGESWGAQMQPMVTVIDKAPMIRKGTKGEDGYSGFTVRDPENPEEIEPTRLHALLSDRGIDRVVVIGVATDYCVKETALDAIRLGYETIALVDGIRAVDLAEGDGDAAIAAMQEAGVAIV
ncbi:MAG: isochorismatase family protein [Acidimicrobiia bacterium]